MPRQTAKVTMYRTRGCPFCVMAEQFLDQPSITQPEYQSVAFANAGPFENLVCCPAHG